MVKFLRRTWNRYSKLGKKRKKKQIWRRPTGRDNKMREKRKGYPVIVNEGYKKSKEIRNKIEGKNPVLIKNILDLNRIKNKEIAILGKIGKKKKIEIVAKAKEMNIKFHNVNKEKFLQKNKMKKKKIEDKVKIKSKENKK